MDVSFLLERTSGCGLLDDCAFPWHRSPASCVVRSTKSGSGANYGPALSSWLCGHQEVAFLLRLWSGLARTYMVESQEDVPDPLASQQQRSNRSLQWVQKNGHIGHVDASFVDHVWRGAGSMCISRLHIFPVDALRRRPRCPARSSCAAHRGGSGVAVRQLFARPVLWPTLSHSLTLCGQDWSQNTWSLHEQGMGR